MRWSPEARELVLRRGEGLAHRRIRVGGLGGFHVIRVRFESAMPRDMT